MNHLVSVAKKICEKREIKILRRSQRSLFKIFNTKSQFIPPDRFRFSNFFQKNRFQKNRAFPDFALDQVRIINHFYLFDFRALLDF